MSNIVHSHAIEIPWSDKTISRNKVYVWKFRYLTWSDQEGYLGQTEFIGTLEEAEREAHQRVRRFEFEETEVKHVVFEIISRLEQ